MTCDYLVGSELKCLAINRMNGRKCRENYAGSGAINSISLKRKKIKRFIKLGINEIIQFSREKTSKRRTSYFR